MISLQETFETLYPKPDPPKKTLIERSEIYDLAAKNTLLHMAIGLHKYGQASWEEAMMLAVKHLVERDEELMSELIRLTSERPAKFFIKKDVP